MIKLNPYFEIILAGIIWGLSGIFVKILPLPATTITFFRLAVPTIILLIYLKIKKTPLFTGNNKPLLIASTLNAVRVFLYTIGFIFTTIGNGVIILYTWPIFTTLLSMIYLKEKVQKRTFLLLTIAFAGIIVIYSNHKFSFSNKDFIGMTAMLLSSLIYTITIIIFKKELPKYTPIETIFYQNFVGAIIFLPFLFSNKPFPTLSQISIGTIYGIVIGIIGFILFFAGLKKLKTSTASFLTYIEVVSAIIFGIIIFKETITWNMIAGGLLIITSTILIKKEK